MDVTDGIVVDNIGGSPFIAIDDEDADTGPQKHKAQDQLARSTKMDIDDQQQRTAYGTKSEKFLKIIERLGTDRKAAEKKARPIVNAFRKARDEEGHVVPCITDDARSIGRLLDLEIYNGGFLAGNGLPTSGTDEWALVGLLGIPRDEDADLLNDTVHDAELNMLGGKKPAMIRVTAARVTDKGGFVQFARDAKRMTDVAMAQPSTPKSESQEAYEEMMCIGAFTMPPERLALAEAHANAIAMGQAPAPVAMAIPDMGPPPEVDVGGYWDCVPTACVDGKNVAAESDEDAANYWGKMWHGSAEELAATG